jgi:hypothetical protein
MRVGNKATVEREDSGPNKRMEEMRFPDEGSATAGIRLCSWRLTIYASLDEERKDCDEAIKHSQTHC